MGELSIASPTLWISASAVAAGSAVTVRMARGMALRRGLLDVPNSRSSHVAPVPRLGGAAFVPLVFLAAMMAGPRGTVESELFSVFLIGALGLFTLSLVDDFVALPTSFRLAVHALVAFGFVTALRRAWPDPGAAAGVMGFLLPTSPGGWLLALWVLGLTNLYNFMDGIDGIAGVQGVVAGLAWWVFGSAASAPLVACLGALLAAGSVGFLTLNWPPARIFMGDAGSTVLGYTFAVLPLLAAVERGTALRFDAAVMAGFFVVWPFCADGTFTLLRRLRQGENILLAHRSHLYQRLVIAGVSHARVTLTYGALAGLGAGVGWLVTRGVPYAGWVGALAVVAGFVALWRWTVTCETRAAVRR